MIDLEQNFLTLLRFFLQLLIIPLDQEFLVQQVFCFVELRQFFILFFFLVFEVVKLCRVNLESPDST